MPHPVARRDGPRVWAVFTLLAAAALARAAADPPDAKVPPAPAAAAPPPPPKALSEAAAKGVDELNKTIDALWRSGTFAEAVEPARQIAAICEKALGPDHWHTADARRQVETLNTIAGLPAEGRRALAAGPAMFQELKGAFGKARYADAERLGRQLVEAWRHWLGQDHPDTAPS